MAMQGGRRWFAMVCLAACGCTAMREIPPAEYAAVAERPVVRVETRSGARYELERVRIGPDSLTGLARRDTPSRFEEFDTVALSLDDVVRMSTRGVDWYRTGVIAGVAAAVALAVILSQSASNGGSGGDGPCGPRPCE